METKWADYLISGIWVDDDDEITHVMLHVDLGSQFERGLKMLEADVISLIDKKFTVKTMMWSYQYQKWIQGETVGILKRNGKRYLRSHRDGTINNNLQSLVPMKGFIK